MVFKKDPLIRFAFQGLLKEFSSPEYQNKGVSRAIRTRFYSSRAFQSIQ